MADERDARTEGRRRRTRETETRLTGRWQGGWWDRGKKKEERIKRRVPVVLPIDNGFHLYNSTPRATLDPFCLFSLMLFYHPFARCVPRVTYRMPSTHALALFSFAKILSSSSANGNHSFDVFALVFVSVISAAFAFVSTPFGQLLSQTGPLLSARNFASRVCRARSEKHEPRFGGYLRGPIETETRRARKR